MNSKYDQILIFSFICLICIGIVNLYSASHYIADVKFGNSFFFFKKHIYFILTAFIFIWFFINFSIFQNRTLSTLFFLLSVLLLLFLILGFGGVVTYGGATRWLRVPYFGITFMPSFLAAFASILMLSNFKKRDYPDRQISLVRFWSICTVLYLPAALIFLQPDASNTIVYMVILFIMQYLTGFKSLGFLAAELFVLMPPFLWLLFSAPYRLKRLTAFLSPWESVNDISYQITQSLIAVANGGLLGTGYNNGLAKYLYLPDIINDFALANWAEEFGFAGLVLLCALFFIFMTRSIRIAFYSTNPVHKNLAIGIASWLAVQFIINFASTIALIPVTGIGCPYISYGGTALITQMTAGGILIYLSSQTGSHTDYLKQTRVFISGHAKRVLDAAMSVFMKFRDNQIYRFLEIVSIFVALCVSLIQLYLWIL